MPLPCSTRKPYSTRLRPQRKLQSPYVAGPADGKKKRNSRWDLYFPHAMSGRTYQRGPRRVGESNRAVCRLAGSRACSMVSRFLEAGIHLAVPKVMHTRLFNELSAQLVSFRDNVTVEEQGGYTRSCVLVRWGCCSACVLTLHSGLCAAPVVSSGVG